MVSMTVMLLSWAILSVETQRKFLFFYHISDPSDNLLPQCVSRN